jgi:MFS family permease
MKSAWSQHVHRDPDQPTPIDAYPVVFAGLLLFAGALGDRFGRRELLVTGLAVFGVAAALGMRTSDPHQLIALRALMGIGAAAIMPTTLSVITTSFSEADRPKAIGVWVGVAGGGAVLGLFASGILLEYFSWSSLFELNVVLAGVALVGTSSWYRTHWIPIDPVWTSSAACCR